MSKDLFLLHIILNGNFVSVKRSYRKKKECCKKNNLKGKTFHITKYGSWHLFLVTYITDISMYTYPNTYCSMWQTGQVLLNLTHF